MPKRIASANEKERMKIYREKNRESIKAKAKLWRQANSESIRVKYNKDRDKINARNTERRRAKGIPARIKDDKQIFVFDICGNKIATYKNRYYFNHSELCKKWSLSDARFSNKKEQHCIGGKLFITNIEDFFVDYQTTKSNHNPLREREQIAGIYTDSQNPFEITIEEAAFTISYKYHSWQRRYIMNPDSDKNFNRNVCPSRNCMDEFFRNKNQVDIEESITFYGTPYFYTT